MKIRPKARPIRLLVEQLEGRLVPSTVVPAPPASPAPYAVWGSTNWSGIDLDTTKGAVTAVSGAWTVPAVTSTSAGGKPLAGYSATWVGIDGDLSTTVEQIGTESDTKSTSTADGTPQYYAWFEMYPANWFYVTVTAKVLVNGVLTPETVTAPVHPGDPISASVVYNPTPKNFTLSISDSTPFTLTFNEPKEPTQIVSFPTGWSFSTTQVLPRNQTAQRDSAEWIVEAPASSSVLPLANFGSVTFTNTQATINGSSGTIAALASNASVINYGTSGNPARINIMDMGTFTRSGQWTSIEDEVTALTGGNSFTVAYNTTPTVGFTPGYSPPAGTVFYGNTERIPGQQNVALLSPMPPSAINLAVTQLSLYGSANRAAVQDAPAAAGMSPSEVSRDPGKFVIQAHPGAGAGLANGTLFVEARDVASLENHLLPSAPPVSGAVRREWELLLVPMTEETQEPEPSTNGQSPQSTVELGGRHSAAALPLLAAWLLGWNPPASADRETARKKHA